MFDISTFKAKVNEALGLVLEGLESGKDNTKNLREVLNHIKTEWSSNEFMKYREGIGKVILMIGEDNANQKEIYFKNHENFLKYGHLVSANATGNLNSPHDLVLYLSGLKTLMEVMDEHRETIDDYFKQH